ncbi:hypothetical protein [Chryseobacterium shigense]|uniref:Putative membrane protein n=1 Tax=Chryseobacterium shigense TaxID=297244 RepID=A0A841NKP6_9FLAO|nr:hypothetical protein [Chryseobacterium shigense]MBB6371355.1 putative membrane protein [Chryseobacterium shigense]
MRTNNLFYLKTPIIHLIKEKKEIEKLPVVLQNVIERQYFLENNSYINQTPLYGQLVYTQVVFDRIGFSKVINM